MNGQNVVALTEYRRSAERPCAIAEHLAHCSLVYSRALFTQMRSAGEAKPKLLKALHCLNSRPLMEQIESSGLGEISLIYINQKLYHLRISIGGCIVLIRVQGDSFGSSDYNEGSSRTIATIDAIVLPFDLDLPEPPDGPGEGMSSWHKRTIQIGVKSIRYGRNLLNNLWRDTSSKQISGIR